MLLFPRVTIRRKDELDALEAVGRIVARARDAMRREARPGISTAALDAVGQAVFEAEGARSAPHLVYAFPGSSCISVNDEAVHGIPGPRILRAGDVVKLDVTAEKDGFMADAACTVLLEPRAPAAARLAACARRAFRRALPLVRPGMPVRRIGRAISEETRRWGFAILPELGGHGIGRSIHEAPSVPNFEDPLVRARFEEGMVVAIEPVLCAGTGETYLAADGWTVKTSDASPAVHYEHTVVVTRGAPIVLTR